MKIFYPLIHFLSGCNGCSQAFVKPGAKRFFLVSYVGVMAHVFVSFSTACHKQGFSWNVQQLGHAPLLLWDPGVCEPRFYPSSHHTMPFTDIP